jgi:outer membrane protein insertion porin family
MRKALTLLALVVTLSAEVIEKIEYNNLGFISNESVNDITKITEGDEFDEEAINKAIKELYAQEYFEDIAVSFDAGVLTYEFKEKPSMSKIDIRGYKNNQDEIDEFFTTLGIKKGDMYDKVRIQKLQENFVEHLANEGKIDSIVEVEVEKISEQSVEVTFVVNQGEKLTITKQNIFGNTALNKEQIDSMLINKERDPIWGWMWGFNSGEVKLDQLKYDSMRLKDLYMQNGYIDAVVTTPLLSVDFNDYSATMDMMVKEGKQYLVESIDVTYVDYDEVIALDELTEDVKLKANAPFNVSHLRADLEKIKRKIADKGYAYVKVLPDIKKKDDEAKVTVVYRIKTGEKVTINDVIISGNSRTIDRVIRREIFLAPGDEYSLTEIQESKNALQRTGYFEGVDIQEKRVSDSTMNLIVEVKEAPTGNIMAGGGYGSYDGLMFNASISDKNIVGSGINVSLSTEISQRAQKNSLSFLNPRLNDSTYSAGLSFFINSYEYDYDYDDSTDDVYYTNKSRGGYISFGKILNRYLKGGLTLNYIYTDISSTSDYYLTDSYIKSSIAPSLTFNNTDDYFVPRSGVYATTSLEYADKIFDTNTQFLKTYSTLQTFWGFRDWIDFDAILRYKLRFGYVNTFGYTPTSERFYLGGVRTVRGFTYNKVYPISSDDDGTSIYGGTNSLSHSIELSLPLIPSAKMRFALFYDQGWINNGPLDATDAMYIAGTGAVIEWYAPIGPVQFVFSRAVDGSGLSSQLGNYESQFEFTIGQRF